MRISGYQTILYGAVAGIEICWLYVVIDTLNKKVAWGMLSVFGLLLIYPLSFGFSFLLKRRRWYRGVIYSLSWILWLAVMLFSIKSQLYADFRLLDFDWLLALSRAIAEIIYIFRPEILILIVSAVLWWLGQRLASLELDFGTLVSEFQFGLIILVATYLVAKELGVALTHSVYVTMFFFVFSLLGLSISYALEGISWLSGLYRGHWSGPLLISIGLILALGLLISAVVTPDLLQLLLTAIKWLWGFILKGINFLISLLPEPSLPSGGALPSEPMPTPPPEPDWPKLFNMPDSVRNSLRISWSVMAIGFLIFALWRISSDIFSWLRHKLASRADAEFEPLSGAFAADVLNLVKRLVKWLLGLRLRQRARKGFSLPEVHSVRRIYRQLLRWARDAGYPRLPSQTPHEYCHNLVSLLPEANADLELITHQYVGMRYGFSLPTEDELHHLTLSWYRVRQNNLKKKKPR